MEGSSYSEKWLHVWLFIKTLVFLYHSVVKVLNQKHQTKGTMSFFNHILNYLGTKFLYVHKTEKTQNNIKIAVSLHFRNRCNAQDLHPVGQNWACSAEQS